MKSFEAIEILHFKKISIESYFLVLTTIAIKLWTIDIAIFLREMESFIALVPEQRLPLESLTLLEQTGHDEAEFRPGKEIPFCKRLSNKRSSLFDLANGKGTNDLAYSVLVFSAYSWSSQQF